MKVYLFNEKETQAAPNQIAHLGETNQQTDYKKPWETESDIKALDKTQRTYNTVKLSPVGGRNAPIVFQPP